MNHERVHEKKRGRLISENANGKDTSISALKTKVIGNFYYS